MRVLSNVPVLSVSAEADLLAHIFFISIYNGKHVIKAVSCQMLIVIPCFPLPVLLLVCGSLVKVKSSSIPTPA